MKAIVDRLDGKPQVVFPGVLSVEDINGLSIKLVTLNGDKYLNRCSTSSKKVIDRIEKITLVFGDE